MVRGVWSHREEGPGHFLMSKKPLIVQASGFNIWVELCVKESLCTFCRLLPVLEKFMKDSLDHELRSRTEDVPVVLPVTSKVAAYSRSYIYTPEFQYNLVCSVLFKNVTYPNQGTVGECSKAMNTSNIPEVLPLRPPSHCLPPIWL